MRQLLSEMSIFEQSKGRRHLILFRAPSLIEIIHVIDMNISIKVDSMYLYSLTCSRSTLWTYMFGMSALAKCHTVITLTWLD